MLQSVDVVILGEAPNPAVQSQESSLPIALRIKAIPKTLSELAEAPMASQLTEGESDLVAVVNRVSTETLRTLAVGACLLGDNSAASLEIDRIDARLKCEP